MLRSPVMFLALLVAAVPGGRSAEPGAQIYRGVYFYNFETADFTPDGASEAWCVNSAKLKEAELPPDGSPGGPWGTAHIVVRGVLSKLGHYCNLGASKHFLDIKEVLEVRDKKRREP